MSAAFFAPLTRGERAEGERGVGFVFFFDLPRPETRNPPALRATPLVRGAKPAC
jgi:hypothetical protein